MLTGRVVDQMQGGQVGSLWQTSERTGSFSHCSAVCWGAFSPAASWHSSLMLCWPLQGCLVRNMKEAPRFPQIRQAKLLTAFCGSKRSPNQRATESATENGQVSEKVLGHAPKLNAFYLGKPLTASKSH